MKNSNDTVGNRTRDLPACSIVPPCAPNKIGLQIIKKMVLTGENRSTLRKPFVGGNLSGTNPTCFGLGLNPNLQWETGERLPIPHHGPPAPVNWQIP